MDTVGHGRRRALARAGALITLALDGILVVAILVGGGFEALFVLAPAMVGGMLALALPNSGWALGWAAVLVLVTGILLIIGFVGFLFALPVALLVKASRTRDAASASSGPERGSAS